MLELATRTLCEIRAFGGLGPMRSRLTNTDKVRDSVRVFLHMPYYFGSDSIARSSKGNNLYLAVFQRESVASGGELGNVEFDLCPLLGQLFVFWPIL